MLLEVFLCIWVRKVAFLQNFAGKIAFEAFYEICAKYIFDIISFLVLSTKGGRDRNLAGKMADLQWYCRRWRPVLRPMALG